MFVLLNGTSDIINCYKTCVFCVILPILLIIKKQLLNYKLTDLDIENRVLFLKRLVLYMVFDF